MQGMNCLYIPQALVQFVDEPTLFVEHQLLKQLAQQVK